MSLKQNKKWTILYYANGNNEYEPEMYKAFIDSQIYGSDENINIVMEIGRLDRESLSILRGGKVPEEKGEAWTGVRRYYIEKGRAVLKNKLGAKNMADPGTLFHFLYWGMTAYPADHYMVVLGGHGASFVGTLTDYTQNRPYIMGTVEMCRAIDMIYKRTGKKIDILVLDLCYMNLAEILYELGYRDNNTVKNLLTYMETGPVSGIPFDKLIGCIKDNIDIKDVKGILKEVIDRNSLDLTAFELNSEVLKRVKMYSSDLAHSYLKSGWGERKSPQELLDDLNPAYPWHHTTEKLNNELAGLIIYSKNSDHRKCRIVKIIADELRELVKLYSKLEFAKDNYWLNLIGNIPLNEKIRIEDSSIFEPLSIKPDGFRTLIRIMNPSLDETGIEYIYKEFSEIRGWNW